jgi:hypothetical protein
MFAMCVQLRHRFGARRGVGVGRVQTAEAAAPMFR